MNIWNLKYTKDHEWVNIDGDTATVGITDFTKRIRDIVYVEVETLDQSLDKDAVLVPLKRLKQFLICSSHCQVKLLHSMMHLKVLWKCKFLILRSGMDDQDKKFQIWQR
jgi:hypothetical protein